MTNWKRVSKTILLATMVLSHLSAAQIAQAKTAETITTYVADKEHTSIGFEIQHLMISKVKGRFDKFQGTVEVNNNNLSKISGSVEAASINTNQEKRDKHLRSADFFNVEKFLTLSFEASDLNIKKGETKKAKGKLTIRGVTRTEDVEIEFAGLAEDPWGTKKIILNATAEINRKDYGLTWNEALETGGVMVGEKVKIEINFQGNQK